MPFSMQAPNNLVQSAFDAYNAPIQSQILQQDLSLKKEEVVAQQMAIQNQIGIQQDMTKIWGPGGIGSAQDATDNPSIDQMPKFMATAQSLAMHGQPQAAMTMLSTASLLGMRQAETQKYAQQATWRQLEVAGSALGGVKAGDQASEDVALATMRAQGIDPAKYGLVGDIASDWDKIPALSQSAMSRAQQIHQADRDRTFAEKVQQDHFHDSVASMRLGQGAQRITIANGNLDLHQKEFVDKQNEENKRDARAQDGLDLKTNDRNDKILANARRVTSVDVQQADGVVQSDSRTSGIAPPLQKAIARMAARYAKDDVAHEYGQDAPPGAYDAALSKALDKMEKRGDFKQAQSSDYKFNAPVPAAPKYSPVKPPIPSTPKGIPEGSKVIGKTPDGSKDVWQDPKGNKWTE
jgi:hypothetical protein